MKPAEPGHSAGGIGIYLHVPYCAALCHYCDFAKTARFDASSTQRYFTQLEKHLRAWLSAYEVYRPGFKVSSVFFGGGTPSLFVREIATLMEVVEDRLLSGAEVTMEANPEHCEPSRLRDWRDAGVTRISMGIQSFDTAGLRFLTRTHSGGTVRRALGDALSIVPSVSGDLIYGWPGQTLESWRNDVETLMASGAQHMSCYALTYEKQTPIGRRRDRGIVTAIDETSEAGMFQSAHEILTAGGMDHYEVSNFARPGHQSVHNRGYWQFKDWLAVGVGAHSFVRGVGTWGVRFSYPRQERTFLEMAPPPVGILGDERSAQESLAGLGFSLDERTLEGWILERASCGLRTTEGCDVGLIEQETGRRFEPSPAMAEGIRRGLVQVTSSRIMRLRPEEWFREHAWIRELARSLAGPGV